MKSMTTTHMLAILFRKIMKCQVAVIKNTTNNKGDSHPCYAP